MITQQIQQIRRARLRLGEIREAVEKCKAVLTEVPVLGPTEDVQAAICRCKEDLSDLTIHGDESADQGWSHGHMQKPTKQLWDLISAMEQCLELRSTIRENLQHIADAEHPKAVQLLVLVGNVAGRIGNIEGQLDTAALTDYVDGIRQQLETRLNGVVAMVGPSTETTPVCTEDTLSTILQDAKEHGDSCTDTFLDLRSTLLSAIEHQIKRKMPSDQELVRHLGTLWFLVEHSPAPLRLQTAQMCMSCVCQIADQHSIDFERIPGGSVLDLIAAECGRGA